MTLANAYGVSVEEALTKIAAEHPTIATQFEQCSTGSKTIPPEVLGVYTHPSSGRCRRALRRAPGGAKAWGMRTCERCGMR